MTGVLITILAAIGGWVVVGIATVALLAGARTLCSRGASVGQELPRAGSPIRRKAFVVRPVRARYCRRGARRPVSYAPVRRDLMVGARPAGPSRR